MKKGYVAALGFFVVGVASTLFLEDGKQFAIASLSYCASAAIAVITYLEGDR